LDTRAAARGRVDLVVDVGHVDDQAARVAGVLEEALEQAEDDERARVADMDPCVHRRSADVDPDAAGVARLEFADTARAGVVEAKLSHRASRSPAPPRLRGARRSRSPRRWSPSR